MDAAPATTHRSDASVDAAHAADATTDVVDARPPSDPLPACSWPSDLLSPTSALDPPDGFGARCIAGRRFLICESANAGVGCITNDAQCPTFGFGTSSPMVPGASTQVCRDQCDPTEYAAGCGGGGGPLGQSLPPPSSACREVRGGMGGPIYCCPCGVARPSEEGHPM